MKSPFIGQISGFYSNENVVRGKHFHHTKIERFLILSGKAKFKFEHFISRAKYEKVLTYNKPCIVETFPGWIHSIQNVGDNLLSGIIWANDIFDKSKPDTYYNGDI